MPLLVDDKLTKKNGVLIYHIDSKPSELNAEANALLADKDPGTFYIRVSNTKQNCLVIQFVKYNKEILKKLVEPVASASPSSVKLAEKPEVFSSLRELIAHYSTNPIVPCNKFELSPNSEQPVCTLAQVLIKSGLAKFDFTTKKCNVADVADLTVLPCEAGCKVAVVDETAGAYVAIDRRNGYYGNLRTSYHDDELEDCRNLEEDLTELLQLSVDFKENSRFPADAVAVVNYAVPYSEKTLNFKEGDKIIVEKCITEEGSSDSVLYGRLKYNRTISGRFPRFSVKLC